MDVAFNIDKNYVKYCAILIASIESNNRNVTYHVLHHELDDVDEAEIRANSGAGNRINFYKVDTSIFSNLPKTKQWPEAIYYRLMIADIVTDDIERILYLDCDILVRGELNELFTMDMEGIGLAAVEDVLSPISPMLENIGCAPSYGYFNSGVLLINVSYWKENNVLSDIFEFINENVDILQHPDQDALNSIFSRKWKKLHYRWNFLRAYQNLYYSESHMFSDYNKDSKYYPVIVHFSGVKPWNPKSRSIYKYQYHEFMRYAKYSNLVPKPRIIDKLEFMFIKILDRTNILKFRLNYFL